MDRKTLKVPFSLNQPPDWVCPTCRKGILRIKEGSFHKEERRHSKDRSHPAWDPEWIEFVYSCLLVCTSGQCKEVVSSTGVGSVEASFEFDEDTGIVQDDYEERFSPKYFEPHLNFLEIPEKCPKTVSGPLCESFQLFFSSPSAAANCVRTAIEALFTEIGVKRFNTVSGQRRFISLHQRIDLLPPRYAHLKDFILAIKWLGNVGSHANGNRKGAITLDDVIDSFELTEHVLLEIYAPKTKRLTRLAKKINQNKGPVAVRRVKSSF